MADFSALKTAIQANIRTNGNEEITGAILQDILLSMVTTMGDGAINALSEALQAESVNRQNAVSGEATARADADSELSGRINLVSQAVTAITTKLNEGYLYAGIATPSTNPGTPAGKVLYIALQAGTYTNFSSLVVTQGINILKYNGTAWSQEQLVAIDDVPTAGSNGLVKSGGVDNAIKESHFKPFVNTTIIGLSDGMDYKQGYMTSDGGWDNNSSFKSCILPIDGIEQIVCSYDQSSPSFVINTLDSDKEFVSNLARYVNANVTINCKSLVSSVKYVIIGAVESAGIHIEVTPFIKKSDYPQMDNSDVITSDGVYGGVNDAKAEIAEAISLKDYPRIPKVANSTIANAYMGAGDVIAQSELSVQYFFVYNVSKGETVHVFGDIGNTNRYCVAFCKNAPSVGTKVDILISHGIPVCDIHFTAPSDGYVITWHRTKNLMLQVYNPYYELSSARDITKTMDSIGILKTMGAELQKENRIIATSYINSAGTIVYDKTLTTMYCLIYPVLAGEHIIVDGYGFEGSHASNAAFFTNPPYAGDTAYEVIQVGDGDYKVNKAYIAPCNGWVVTFHRNDSTVVKAYEEDYSWNGGSLKNKTIAILGDSIMNLMSRDTGDDYFNVRVTFKNYSDPTDTTVYTQDQITIINGIIYLTSSLGEDNTILPTSIRLEVVNDVQDKIDSMSWRLLKKTLRAKDVINFSWGSARVVEKGIVTAYPSVGILSESEERNPIEGQMASLPNLAKWLKRVVDDGRYDAPDCVVIWLGSNGSTQVITDTLEEAMQIPWATLSDDIQGYIYRTKFYGALRYSVEYIYRNFPFANIFILSPVQTNRGNMNIAENAPAYRGYTDYNSVSEALKNFAYRYSCIFVDALHEMGLVNFAYKADSIYSDDHTEIATGTSLGNIIPQYTFDGMHPNNEYGKPLWHNYLVRRLLSLYFDKKPTFSL